MKQLILSISLCMLAAGNLYTDNRFAYDERPEAYSTRAFCAYNQNFNVPNYDISKENNGDEWLVPDFAGNYTKAFPHNATTSVATAIGQQSYDTLRTAVENGKQDTYNAIVRT